MKTKYIDFMEKAFEAYSDERIKQYCDSVYENGISEHGFPRLTTNLGILITHGKKTEYKERFKNMMDICCADVPTSHKRRSDIGGNNFSVKELVMCILEIEKSGIFPKSVTQSWRDSLKEINPYDAYTRISPFPPVRVNNFAAFAAASEQLRKYAHLGDSSEFIENQIQSQLLSFDENGMYRDPHEPIAYDIVTRLQLMIALHYGYDGKGGDDLLNHMLKSADMTLKMISVTGEMPFGGRSNQFIHNETLYAAVCEYYATLFKSRGDLKKAGMFKRAANSSMQLAWKWLNSDDTIHHIKNYYPTNSLYGCEVYAYFDKYMITAATWAYVAYVMADDSIEEVPCPSENENYICETSHYFHKVFCKFGDYSAEFDTNADITYDSTGLGKFQKRDLPSTLCLSVPFTKEPGYKIDVENPSGLSLCGGIKTENAYACTYDGNREYKLIEKELTDTYLQVKFDCDGLYTETYTLSDSGMKIEITGQGEVLFNVPVFLFDGKEYTDISVSATMLEVSYKGHRCRYVSDGKIEDTTKIYANRNGHYKHFTISQKDKVVLYIDMK